MIARIRAVWRALHATPIDWVEATYTLGKYEGMGPEQVPWWSCSLCAHSAPLSNGDPNLPPERDSRPMRHLHAVHPYNLAVALGDVHVNTGSPQVGVGG